MRHYSLTRFSFLLSIVACLTACGGSDSSSIKPSSDTLRVVATTTMVADMARVIAGDDAEIIGLMAPGVDPHSYTLPARAVADLKSADVILYSGLKLEGRSEELYSVNDSAEHHVKAVADAIAKDRLIVTAQFDGHPDPHVWGDVLLWADCVPAVVATLSKARPQLAETFAARGAAYIEELKQLDAWVKARIASIPEARRTLITSHDAFNYFGRAYNIEVVGVQGISTVDKAGLADIAKTVDLIKERSIPAIFAETSVNRDAIQRIANDSGAVVGGLLYSDSLGSAGETETHGGETYDPGTYIGMMKHNVNAIVDALGEPK